MPAKKKREPVKATAYSLRCAHRIIPPSLLAGELFRPRKDEVGFYSSARHAGTDKALALARLLRAFERRVSRVAIVEGSAAPIFDGGHDADNQRQDSAVAGQAFRRLRVSQQVREILAGTFVVKRDK